MPWTIFNTILIELYLLNLINFNRNGKDSDLLKHLKR